MNQIGIFTRTDDGFSGCIRTFMLDVEVTIFPTEKSDAENPPDHRVFLDGHEIGAAWDRTSDKAGKVPVMRLAGIASQPSWSRAPLFVGRSGVHRDDGSETADPPSGRPTTAPAIVDLLALVPPSEGLFVRRPDTSGEQR